MKEDRATEDALLRLLGPADLIRLVEYRGGVRLYVPHEIDGTDLPAHVGDEAAVKLIRRWGGSYIRVPLARELRARHYRAAGMSNAQIAIRLGMAETSVDKLFHRMPAKPVKGSGDPRQLKLFG